MQSRRDFERRQKLLERGDHDVAADENFRARERQLPHVVYDELRELGCMMTG